MTPSCAPTFFISMNSEASNLLMEISIIEHALAKDTHSMDSRFLLVRRVEGFSREEASTILRDLPTETLWEIRPWEKCAQTAEPCQSLVRPQEKQFLFFGVSV